MEHKVIMLCEIEKETKDSYWMVLFIYGMWITKANEVEEKTNSQTQLKIWWLPEGKRVEWEE